jgi:hypothetical protein
LLERLLPTILGLSNSHLFCVWCDMEEHSGASLRQESTHGYSPRSESVKSSKTAVEGIEEQHFVFFHIKRHTYSF